MSYMDQLTPPLSVIDDQPYHYGHGAMLALIAITAENYRLQITEENKTVRLQGLLTRPGKGLEENFHYMKISLSTVLKRAI